MQCHYGDHAVKGSEKQGSVSLVVGAGGHAGVGTEKQMGAVVGTDAEGKFNACTLIQICETTGPGVSGGVFIEGTISNAPVTGTPDFTIGGYGTGGALGKIGVGGSVNINDPTQLSTSGSIGAGGGGSGGLKACQTVYPFCLKR
jgi:hypothetical protein